jgi:uncharacterized protein YlxW (UPF0749 family)
LHRDCHRWTFTLARLLINAELQQAFQGQQEEQTENNEDITIKDLLSRSASLLLRVISPRRMLLVSTVYRPRP